ncbi:MAG TPA: Tad domain-containing protein [Chloroflexia bacterium]|nr:Tad domain-containing protein [Chloroflexia bacterium]
MKALKTKQAPAAPASLGARKVSGTGTKEFLKARPGQAIMPVIFFMLFAVLLLGLVIEAGHLFIARRELQNQADAAATWGAMQLDIDGLRISEGNRVDILSPGDTNEKPADYAGTRLVDYMQARGFRLDEWDWHWSACSMQINITRRVPTLFVSALGIKEATVSVAARARLNNTDNRTGC